MRQTNLIWSIFVRWVLTGLVLSLSVSAQQPVNKLVPSPPGKLVDVGGHRLHINCVGKGNPTVVMEAGAGDFSFDWSLVQPDVARFARVCTYDRAGYAWSDPGPTPRTMQQIAYELHTGLRGARINPPYVLVGHSLGGLMVRVFTSLYPREVAGLVLVDSSHEDQLIVITDRKTGKDTIEHWRELSSGKPIPPVQTIVSTATGPNQSSAARRSSTPTKVEAPYDKLSQNVQQIRLWARSRPNYDAARSSELFDFFAEELARMYGERGNRAHPLGNMPLIVLTRGIANEEEQANKQLLEDHNRLQVDLATLSTNSKQIIAQKSGHHIQLDEPKLVTNAIRQVVNSVRRHSELR